MSKKKKTNVKTTATLENTKKDISELKETGIELDVDIEMEIGIPESIVEETVADEYSAEEVC